ncbi:MAG: hypothetical protein ABWY16_01610 [Pedobacter sp.]|uniref:hypothetical protein n=1 Tax=Pedobacter sp. TaxID=1411316 RepID=UPI00339340B8
MKTYTNTKNITSKIFYDLLKSNFKEMFPKDNLQYGINHDHILVESAGTALYDIEVTDAAFNLTEITPQQKKIGEKLEEFIQASLMPADER